MLGYIFIILGGYTTFVFWSQSTFLAVITGALTLAAVGTQYMITAKNKYGTVNDDKNYVLANMATSVIILIMFIISFFVGK